MPQPSIELTDDEKSRIVETVTEEYGDEFETKYVIFDSVERTIGGFWEPEQADYGNIQFGDDEDSIYPMGGQQPFITIPQLIELGRWLVNPTPQTKFWLYWRDALVRNLIKQQIAMIVGDGLKASIKEEYNGKEDEEKSRALRKWFKNIGGRGRGINNYVIPWWIIDNYIMSWGAFYKYIGQPGDDPEDVGKLMAKRIPPVNCAVVYHDYRPWMKLIQFPIVQPLLPSTRRSFEEWNPSMFHHLGIVSSVGKTVFEKPRSVPRSKFWYCNLFKKSPVDAIVQDMVSTIKLKFFRDKAVEKGAFPPIIVKVSRHTIRDGDDKKFWRKQRRASKFVGELRAADGIAIEGREYDSQGRIINEGWDVTPLPISGNMMDFEKIFRSVDEQKAYGLFSSLAMVSSTGVQGDTTKLATGKNISSNISGVAKEVRNGIIVCVEEMTRDWHLYTYGEELDLDLLDLTFSEIKENDVQGFSGIIYQAFDRGWITASEGRMLLARVGIELPEMTDDDLAGIGTPFEGLGEEEQLSEDRLPEAVQEKMNEAAEPVE